MFYALTKNNQRIHINQAAASEQYFCPECHQLLIIKKGIKTKKHFSHKKGRHCSIHSGETQRHQQAKEQIFMHLSQKFNVKIEYRIYIDKILRIADIYLPDQKYIIEFQHSVIPYQTLLDRHLFYTNNGYQVLWLLDDDLVVIKYQKIKLTRFLRSFINYTSSHFYLVTYSTVQKKCFVYDLYVNSLFEQYVGYYKTAITFEQLIKKDIKFYRTPTAPKINQQHKMNVMKQAIKYNRSVQHQLLADIYQLKWHIHHLPDYIGKIYPQQLLLGCSILQWQVHISLLKNIYSYHSHDIVRHLLSKYPRYKSIYLDEYQIKLLVKVMFEKFLKTLP